LCYCRTMDEMPQAVFEGHKRSLIMKLSEKLTSLEEESNSLWEHIRGGYLDFDRGKAIVRTLF
jgi:insulysin